MEYTRLGSSGLTVSRIVLGCMSYGEPARGGHGWSLPEDQSRPFFREAVEAGITTFDTANVYSLGSSEEITGRMLREFTTRDQVVIATKLAMSMGSGPNDRGLSRGAIMTQIDASLKRLGTDYVDLYQIHRFDPHTPIEETMAALHDVVTAGKARYIGASSMWARQFQAMQHAAALNGWTRFVSMQDQYNPIMREEEREMHPLCWTPGSGCSLWSPLARGHLSRPYGQSSARRDLDETGRRLYRQDEDADRAISAAIGEIAEARGVTRAQVTLAWQFTKPAVTAPIVGATRPGHIADAIAAAQLRLSPDEVERIEAPYTPRHPEAFV